MEIGLLYTRMRQEERLLVEAAEARNVTVTPIRDADLVLGLGAPDMPGDVVLARSMSATRSTHILRALHHAGRPAVNPYMTAVTCADKADTSLRLARAGIPTPDTRIAFDEQSALQAMESLGYPVVLKPTVGSWGRLVAKAHDADQARQLLEHRAAIPSPQQHVYYVQQYVDTRNGVTNEAGLRLHRDIRAFVVGGTTIAAIHRTSADWVTNTARGAQAVAHPVDDELNDLCVRAAEAVGGGVLAVDLLEGPDGLLVTEINHTMEFRNSIAPTGVDIPGAVIDYCIDEARA